MLCRFLLAVALSIIAHSDAAVNSARVTFNTVAFPSAGESLKLVVQSLHDDPILVQMKHKAPYPIYTASISMKDTLTARYEYVIIRADNTTLHETALFGSSGVARVLKSVGPEMSTMNEFFGEVTRHAAWHHHLWTAATISRHPKVLPPPNPPLTVSQRESRSCPSSPFS